MPLRVEWIENVQPSSTAKQKIAAFLAVAAFWDPSIPEPASKLHVGPSKDHVIRSLKGSGCPQPSAGGRFSTFHQPDGRSVHFLPHQNRPREGVADNSMVRQ